jgi:hypothetical protein
LVDIEQKTQEILELEDTLKAHKRHNVELAMDVTRLRQEIQTKYEGLISDEEINVEMMRDE